MQRLLIKKKKDFLKNNKTHVKTYLKKKKGKKKFKKGKKLVCHTLILNFV